MNEQQAEYKVIDRRIQEQEPMLPAKIGDSQFLIMIERLSSRPDIPVEKIKQLMEMQEHILDRDAQQAFNAAMVRAQMHMPIIPRDKKNEQTHSMYSKYETILKLAKPIYTREGFSVLFHEGHGTPDHPLKDNHIRMIADVMHEQGHTKIVTSDIPLDLTGMAGKVNKTTTHATGSSFSYARNYMIRLIFNIPTGDEDDGNAAGGTTKITPFEKWEIKCDEVAQEKADMTKWWLTNKSVIQKELKEAESAKIYNKANAHKKLIEAEKLKEREPGSEG